MSLAAQPDVEGLLLQLQAEPGGPVAETHGAIVAAILDAVETLEGDAARQRLEREGVEALHQVLAPNNIGPLRDQVIERLRAPLLSLAVRLGRERLGWEQEFYVDDYLILRINFPYEVARQVEGAVENPGIGRVSPAVQETAKARRVSDPVYRPVDYHRGHSPAAWAHGPHVDSWAGHSRNGVNMWWAIGETPAEAGMLIYPELGRGPFPRDPATLYLAPGYPLPAPTLLPLSAGEMLIFDPEMLHGTRLNTTGRTRVAVSLRLNASRPVFDPRCFYAREFWRRASDIEAGRLDQVIHLKREDNLAPDLEAPAEAELAPIRPVATAAPRPDGRFALPTNLAPVEGQAAPIDAGGRRLSLARSDGALFAFDARCPHYGLDLADGAIADGQVYCPGCGVGFSLATGSSGTPSLTLGRWGVEVVHDEILLTPAP